MAPTLPCSPPLEEGPDPTAAPAGNAKEPLHGTGVPLGLPPPPHKVVGAGKSTCTFPPIPLHPTHPSLLIPPLLQHLRALPRSSRAGGTRGAPCPALAEGVGRRMLEMGDASLPPLLHPSQPPVPQSIPSSLQCPQQVQAPGGLRACGTMPGTWREQLRPCSHASEPCREGGSSWVAMEERKQLRKKPFQAGRNQWGTRAGAAGLPAAGEGGGVGENISARFGGGGATSASRLMEPREGNLLPSPSLMDAEPPGSPPPAPLLPLSSTT